MCNCLKENRNEIMLLIVVLLIPFLVWIYDRISHKRERNRVERVGRRYGYIQEIERTGPTLMGRKE